MKIMVIPPGALTKEWMEARERYLSPLCSPGTEVEVLPVEGVPAPDDPAKWGLIGVSTLRRVEQAMKEGYDAVFIHCSPDLHVVEAKSIANIPVVGGGEPVLHVASMLADRFGLITGVEQEIPMLIRLVDACGIANRIVSIKAIGFPYEEYLRRKDEVETKFVRLAKEQMEHGAQLIVPAELLILIGLGSGSATRLSQKLGIPVLDSVAIAFKVAEMLATLKISQSKLAFATP